jgi:hypothetical protein
MKQESERQNVSFSEMFTEAFSRTLFIFRDYRVRGQPIAANGEPLTFNGKHLERT